MVKRRNLINAFMGGVLLCCAIDNAFMHRPNKCALDAVLCVLNVVACLL